MKSANGASGSRREAEKELAEFYPKDADGATPIAYLWARTIRCEGPGCGAEVPLIRSLAAKNQSPLLYRAADAFACGWRIREKAALH